MSLRNGFFFAALAGLLACLPSSAAAELTARVDRNELLPGETVTLQLRQDDRSAGLQPDLAPLEKDFRILDRRQSQQIRIINGRQEANIDLQVVLLPKQAGTVTIPALRSGSESTRPITLRVLSEVKRDDRARSDLFAKAELSDAAPYAQAETLYTVRIFDALGMLQANVEAPEIPGVRVETSGEARANQEIIGGRRYTVHEQQFRLIPEKAGTFEIPPTVVTARVPDERPSRRSRFDDFFGRSGFGSGLFDSMMNPGRSVRIATNPLSLEAQERPSEARQGWFLPARHVSLAEEWIPAEGEVRVGDALTRVVKLRALGASTEQLPVFAIPEPGGASQYDEGEREGTRPTEDGTLSVREQTVTILPTRAGTLEIPPVEVPWFDVTTQEVRKATLPGRTFTVVAAPGATEAAPPGQPPLPAVATREASPDSQASDAGLAPDPATVATLVAVLMAIAGGAFALSRRRTDAREPGVSVRAAARSVDAACRAHDARRARQALLEWGRIALPGSAIRHPLDIHRQIPDDDFREALRALDAHLFRPDPGPWSGDDLRRSFARIRSRRQHRPETGSTPLPALYPSR